MENRHTIGSMAKNNSANVAVNNYNYSSKGTVNIDQIKLSVRPWMMITILKYIPDLFHYLSWMIPGA